MTDEQTETYDAAAERIKQQAAEHKQQYDEQHNELLEAAAADEELVVEEHETARIGDATLTVKTTLTGETARKLDTAYSFNAAPGEALDACVDVLAEQTVRIEAAGNEWGDKEDIREFFRGFIDKYDAESASLLCMERVIEGPTDREQERRQDVVNSFPGARHGTHGRRSGGGGPRPE